MKRGKPKPGPTKEGNYQCPNPCCYYKRCKLTPGKSITCKAQGYFPPQKIFGLTWEQIQLLQQGGR